MGGGRAKEEEGEPSVGEEWLFHCKTIVLENRFDGFSIWLKEANIDIFERHEEILCPYYALLPFLLSTPSENVKTQTTWKLKM